MKQRLTLLAVVGMLVLAADQLTKWLVVNHIPEYRSIPVIPGLLDLVNIRNRGAAFGFLNRSDIEWQFWLFLVTTLLACCAIGYVVCTLRQRSVLLVTGLGCILGGALGNLLDRLRMRAVVDFLDFYWQEWHWPAFNIADTGICIGAFCICIVLCREEKTQSDASDV